MMQQVRAWLCGIGFEAACPPRVRKPDDRLVRELLDEAVRVEREYARLGIHITRQGRNVRHFAHQDGGDRDLA